MAANRLRKAEYHWTATIKSSRKANPPPDDRGRYGKWTEPGVRSTCSVAFGSRWRTPGSYPWWERWPPSLSSSLSPDGLGIPHRRPP